MVAELHKPAIDAGLVVSDANRALRFWRDTIGFPLDEVRELPNGEGKQYRLRCGDSLVKLLALSDPPEDTVAGPPRGARGLRYLTIFVRNLDALVESCREAGYRITMEPQVSPIFPNRIAFVEDPDGNWLELFESESG